MSWTRRRPLRRLAAFASRGWRQSTGGVSAAVRGVSVGVEAAGCFVRNTLSQVIDGAVMAVSPEAGLRRMAMRKIAADAEARMSYRGDDRGSDSSDRLHGAQRWLQSRLSPDSDLEASMETLQDRSLELYQHTTSGGVIDSRVDHVIGKGFTVQAKIVAGPGISEEAAKGWNEQLESVYQRWSPKCDVTGTMSLWELSRLNERSVGVWGESFTVIWYKQRKGQPIPMVLEVVDPRRISTPPDKAGDPNCRLGVQYDSDGEIVGYWLRTTHPYDTRQLSYKWEMIPRERMLHVFERWFPGQSRGFPWLMRAMDRLRDGEDLDEAGIIAAQVEACSAAFVKTRSPLKGAKAMSTGTDASGARLEDTVPGKIHYLESGSEEIYFQNPTKSNIVGTLHEWNHRRVAAGINWPYEFLMKDWRGVSFAGGRLILNGAKITCQCEQQLQTVAWFAGVWNELVRLSVVFSQYSGVEINVSAYERRAWVYQAHKWSAPSWSYAITPGEEVRANVDAVENNQKTLADVCAENGSNLEDVIKQRQKERQMERDANVEPPDRIAAIAQQGKNAQNPQAKEAKNAA